LRVLAVDGQYYLPSIRKLPSHRCRFCIERQFESIFAIRQVGCRFVLKAHNGLSSVTLIQHPHAGQDRTLDMNNVVLDCREIEKLCRQRAISDRARSWKWLGEADRWNNLAHREIASRFQNEPMHAGPMAMGPNTIKGDSHRQKHESMQRLQSVMRGG
jgi:hypothetical protein